MKILFILNSCLGDVILSTGVIRYYIETYKHAKITYVKDKRSKNILTDFPNTEAIIEYSKKKYSWHWIEIYGILKKENFDIIIDFKNTFLSYILPSLKSKRIYSTNRNKYILEVFKELIDKPFLPKPYLFVNANKKNNYIASLELPRKYLVVLPTLLSKDIQPEFYIKLINCSKIPIIICGSLFEKEFITKYKEILNASKFRFIDNSTVIEAVYIIQNSIGFIGCDSGLYHVATALNKTTLCFFENKEKYTIYSSRNLNCINHIIDSNQY